MRNNWRPPSRWRFSIAVLVPAVLALLVTLALVVGFLFWASAGVDQRSLENQSQMVENLIGHELARIPHDQQSVSIWDDAVTNTAIDFDMHWIDVNLGVWMYDFFGHDKVYVLDADGRPVYAMDRGSIAAPARYAEISGAIAGYVSELRDKIAAGALDAYNAGTGEYPQVVDVARIGGLPAIVSVVPIISDSGAIEQAPGKEFLHISIVELNPAYARSLAADHMLQGANFATFELAEPGKSSFPIVNGAGRVVAFFGWTPSRPGQQLVSQTLPVIAGAFIFAFLMVLILIYRLYRSSRALEAGRASAAHQAAHDTLTGLANRTQFDSGLAAALAEGQPGTPVALIMLDLDRFKQINDTLGHAAGDELLRAVGQRLRELVPPEDLLARLGATSSPSSTSRRAASARRNSWRRRSSTPWVSPSTLPAAKPLPASPLASYLRATANATARSSRARPTSRFTRPRRAAATGPSSTRTR
jgi:sensor domain CHASE-containing protein